MPYFFLGDDAFAMRTYMMKPYGRRNMVQQQKIFNYRLQEPDTVRLLFEAAVMLNNLIRMRYQALDVRMLDQEDAQHNLILGAWRTAAITVRKSCDAALLLMATSGAEWRATSIASAERLPLEDGSVDLLTVASAVHWFDMPAFTREADRVLKPGGCIAVIGTYRIRTVNHQNELIKSKLIECREKYTQELDKYRVIDTKAYYKFYETLEFPSYDMTRWSMEYNRTLTAPAFINFLQTLSFSIKYLERHPNTTFFEEYRDNLHSILVSEKEEKEASFQLTWFYDILIARKPIPTMPTL
ncbi:uncharacterized protein LOC105439561 [Strongylocentrotus purpuratus]|uniref:Methyltransferase type 11 domain-containing protein n=1 Tax=Strongylocentrotus purpuratus TaxID=7668 RepID=A0A7M7N113_STRPU|nr:uncharacterized protein LOC105439561 [Strongylocentrotus purpuratus]